VFNRLPSSCDAHVSKSTGDQALGARTSTHCTSPSSRTTACCHWIHTNEAVEAPLIHNCRTDCVKQRCAKPEHNAPEAVRAVGEAVPDTVPVHKKTAAPLRSLPFSCAAHAFQPAGTQAWSASVCVQLKTMRRCVRLRSARFACDRRCIGRILQLSAPRSISAAFAWKRIRNSSYCCCTYGCGTPRSRLEVRA